MLVPRRRLASFLINSSKVQHLKMRLGQFEKNKQNELDGLCRRRRQKSVRWLLSSLSRRRRNRQDGWHDRTTIAHHLLSNLPVEFRLFSLVLSFFWIPDRHHFSSSSSSYSSSCEKKGEKNQEK